MTPTKPASLVLVFLGAASLLFVVEYALVRLGEPALIPPLSLGLALVLLGAIVPSLAWPVRAMVTRPPDASHSPVSPFYAMRVLLLAKAGALTGAMLAGAGVGISVFLATRMVLVWGSLLLGLASVLGGVVLAIGSLLAERWCQIPPGDVDHPTSESEPA